MTYFLGYAWVPLLSALVFLGGLIALLATWVAEGKPRYEPGDGAIVYISEVGGHMKALFIPMCTVTASTFVLSQIIDRFHRHRGRLAITHRRLERILSSLAVSFSALGGIALILASILDTFHYRVAHWSLVLLFIICITLSTACQTVEFGYLSAEYECFTRLRLSYIVKAITIIVAVALAITMGTLIATSRNSAAALCEWLIACIFDFYIFTMVYDICPTVRTSRHKSGLQELPLGAHLDATNEPAAPTVTNSV